MNLSSPQVAAVTLLPLTLLLAACSDRGGRSEAAEKDRQQRIVQHSRTTSHEGMNDRPVARETVNEDELAPVVAPLPEIDPDEEFRKSIVGVWKQNNTGVRWLRVRPDGTATMFVDPDWVAKAVIGNGLTIQIEWSIEDGQVTMRSVSGEPATAFKAVSTLYGSDRNRTIAELTDRKFVMLDEANGEESVWDRVIEEASVPRMLR